MLYLEKAATGFRPFLVPRYLGWDFESLPRACVGLAAGLSGFVFHEKGADTLNISTFAKALRPYTLSALISNEKLLNTILDWYAEAGRVVGRDGEAFHLDAAKTSRIMNGKVELPNKLREAAARCDIEEKLEDILVDGFPEFVDCDSLELLSSDVVALCAPSQKAMKERLLAAIGDAPKFAAIALVSSIKASNVVSAKRKLRTCGTGSVWVETSDLLSVGFGKKRGGAGKPIVVIPVDAGFHTHVSYGYENEAHPAVADTSLHGQWLMRMFQSGKGLSESSLAKRINESLIRHAGTIAKKGAEWPIGSIAVIETGAAVFYLLAISVFDENSNARATRDEVRGAIRALISFYDCNGQGHDVYVPLMGTGLSRAGMSSNEAYEMLKTEFCSDNVFIAGKVTITVLTDVAADIGLME